MNGRVSLVGAGPGAPDLLTLRGARRLAEADLVFYDALVHPDTLALARRARCFGVGKRAGRPSTSQDAITRLLVRSARRGQRVVRLKCGDPFVLGRGGEEALSLLAAGIPFEVVPGVTSAVAAPLLAGVPLTHRGLASAFLVVSGHSEATLRAMLPAAFVEGLTVVVLMGLRTRATLASLLIERGWSPSARAAAFFAASTSHETTWFGRLHELSEAMPEADGSAGTLVVGDVVAIGERLGLTGGTRVLGPSELAEERCS